MPPLGPMNTQGFGFESLGFASRCRAKRRLFDFYVSVSLRSIRKLFPEALLCPVHSTCFALAPCMFAPAILSADL